MVNHAFEILAMDKEGAEVTARYVSTNPSGINAIVAARQDGFEPYQMNPLGETDEPLSKSLRLPETIDPNVDLFNIEQEYLLSQSK